MICFADVVQPPLKMNTKLMDSTYAANVEQPWVIIVQAVIEHLHLIASVSTEMSTNVKSAGEYSGDIRNGKEIKNKKEGRDINNLSPLQYNPRYNKLGKSQQI